MKSAGNVNVINLASKITVLAFIVFVLLTVILLYSIPFLIDWSSHTDSYIGMQHVKRHVDWRFKLSAELITTISITLILFYLVRLFKNLKANLFFTKQNIRNITIIGYITLIGSVLSSVFSAYSFFKTGNIDFVPYLLISSLQDIEWLGIFLGLIILVIAESFKRGEEIQLEQSLTV